MAFLLGWAAQNTKWVSAVKSREDTHVNSTWELGGEKYPKCQSRREELLLHAEILWSLHWQKKKKKKNVHLSEWTNIQLSRDHSKYFWGPNCTGQGTACWGFQNGHKAALSSSPGIRPQKWELTWSLSPLLLPSASSSWPGLLFLENSLPKGGG